ncbi:hypothetical protein L1277_002707 [Okibacterium sp. HSC-33S16]|uniref:hypothetical protein n=1 Tax=Okibacterium sp. HSC-33S16 TaxID=2910965 RepID=UPI00209E3AF0|nr:hypothetical protein [Okibacterium sp. HSC-33S16]MCP2032597.1 hypothetical protein [Okibacterium sp. HSC-33S16]
MKLDIWSALWPVLGWFIPALVLIFCIGLLRVWVEARIEERRKASEPPPLALEMKMLQLAELTGAAGQLNREVQAELLLAQTETARLKFDAEEAHRVATLNDEQRQAVASLVSGQLGLQLKRSAKSDFRTQLVVNIIFFTAGVAATLFVPPLF